MKNQLIVSYMPLAKKIARKFNLQTPPCVSEEDLLSEAYCGLVDAAMKFDPQKGSFGSFSRFRICGQIKDHLRSLGKSKRDMLLERPIRQQREDEVSSKDFFDFVTTKLTVSEGNILKMYYLEGKTMKEIGASQGFTESRTSQILRSSIDRLKLSLKGVA
jgi:RNA polymerase sigma factor (sigma-70 family)